MLVNLNVCGRNIRPRYIKDYLSAPSTENNSATFTLQNLYSLQCSSSDIQPNFIKVVESCPVSSEDIISYYADHLGGVFYNKHHSRSTWCCVTRRLCGDTYKELQIIVDLTQFQTDFIQSVVTFGLVLITNLKRQFI